MKSYFPRLCAATAALLLWHGSFAGDADMALDVSDAQLTKLGEEFAAAINSGDLEAFEDLFAMEALGLRSATTAFDQEAERRDYVRGFMKSAGTFTDNVMNQIHALDGRAVFLRVRTLQGMRGPLVRYDLGGSGYNYVLLIAENREGKGPKIVDMYIATNGQRVSETIGAATQLMVRPSASLLGKLFGQKAVDGDLAQTFKEIGELQRAGRTADAYAKIRSLPPEVRNHRVLMNMSVQLAGLLGEDVYREELAHLAQYHKDDPSAAFLLIDYYFYQGDTDAAMDVILGLEHAFGADAATAMLKTNVAIEGGELGKAIEYARQGAELEPGNEDSQWTLVTALMLAERYADGIRVFDTLEQVFGYYFDSSSFEGNEIYAGFMRSPEFAAWVGDR